MYFKNKYLLLYVAKVCCIQKHFNKRGKPLYFIIVKYKLQKIHFITVTQSNLNCIFKMLSQVTRKGQKKDTFSKHSVQEYRGINPSNIMMTIYLHNNLQAF